MNTDSSMSLPTAVVQRLQGPLAIVLGSPAITAEVVSQAGVADCVCYQMDVFQAGRLRSELQRRGAHAEVVTLPDLWDLPARFQTVLYPSERGRERELKIDMVEQAQHILVPRGQFLATSEFDNDQLFPGLIKKIFGRVHADTLSRPSAFWGERIKGRPKRRHEQLFRARIGAGESLSFVSRPGTFSYGRMDEGARALVEVAEVRPGDRVLDLGCGCGTNGIFAGRASGPNGHVTFVDSNVRALALAEHNARANGIDGFDVLASATADELTPANFDLALANPPYYADLAIAQAFVERCRRLLRRGGRFYLVTRRIDEMSSIVGPVFGNFQVFGRRGYGVFFADVSE
jgi:16S rRNA (guanine1207-N2)-methyltransferase